MYPKPMYGHIIEPFAGTAKYSLLYWQNEVTIVDKYEILIKIWKWLQIAAPSDVKGLPKRVDPGFKLDSMKFDCDEAKWLFGFLIGKGAERPRGTVSDRVAIARPNAINFSIRKIVENMPKIKHWTIIHGSYLELGNEEATWFIDPPYQFGGHSYVESNRKIDFNSLGDWCMERKGQAIVCENTKANWMDFKPIREQRGSMATTTEAIWSNIPINHRKPQLKLFPV